MIHQFTFGNFKSHDDCGLYIEQRPSPVIPHRDTTKIHIPGRSGDVIQDNGCYNNISLVYKVGCPNIARHFSEITEMLTQSGYQKLKDDYEANALWFRYGVVLDPVSFEEELLKFGHAEIRFDCEPYKYSIPGQIPVAISTSSKTATKLTNPYGHTALPNIEVTVANSLGASVTVMINDKSFLINIPKGRDKIVIDSMSETCYGGNTNLISGYMSDRWPELAPGENTISVTGASSAKIIPNWRSL